MNDPFNQSVSESIQEIILNKFESITPYTFKCPITHDYFIDPVMASDGHMYERKAIEEWFKDNNTSPSTNLIINKNLTSNIVFNNLLKDFYKSNPKIKKIKLTVYDIQYLNDIIINELYDYKDILIYLDIINSEHCKNMFENSKNIKNIFKNDKFVDFLIDNHPLDYKLKNGYMIIHFTCRYESLNMIKKIIDKNIDLEVEDEDKFRPIHYVCSDITNLIGKDQLEVIKLLINKNVNLEVETNYTNYKWRPIHFVCSNNTNLTGGYQLEAIKLLVNKNVDLEAETKNKWRPIHYICDKNSKHDIFYQKQAIILLIDKNVKLDGLTEYDIYPITVIRSLGILFK
jgi:hypothetical protein